MLQKNRIYIYMNGDEKMGDDIKKLQELTAQTNLGQHDKDLAFMEESLALLNRVTQSAFWYILCDKEGKIQSITYSQGVRRLLGLHTTQEFPDKLSAWQKLIHPDDEQKVLHNLYSAVEDKTAQKMYNIEYRMQMPDGTYQWFRSRAEITRRADGTAERMAGIFMNVDQDVRTRQTLQDAFETANRANHAKTDFLSNMSHDIRTPMNAIVGMTAIAGANIDNKARVLDCLAKITQASRHLLGLINEVLDMARIESGKISLDEEEFNLSDLVDNVIVMTRHTIETHHHIFNIHLHKIEHEAVCGDSLRIQQLLTNILTNAIKYTPDGGRISFNIEEIATQSRELGCYEFTIEDNGIGMSKEFQQVLFDPFTRADDKRTTKVQGTGLGMAIAKNIVNMMHGDIKVESELGKGSKFTIRIFLKLQDKELDKLDELIGLPVLVVDDDEQCCENTVAILDDIGLDSEYVTSGQEAVELTWKRYEENNNFFAVILDWQMPEMDGIETARRIRQRVGKDVTIIILSAYDCADFEIEARKAGVDEFIAKPLFRSRLMATFKNILEGHRSKPAEIESLAHIAQCNYTGKRILIVEDNELNAEIAKVIISMTGAETDIATNGKDAVDKFITAPNGFYDLIFMDIQMPIMNGYEATVAIRALDKDDAHTVPIVAMTANAFAEDVVMAKNSGMNEHMAKPLDMNKLHDVLSRWL